MHRSSSAALASVALLCLLARPAGAQPLSLDVRDLDIYDAVRLLATQAAINVVVDSSVQHKPVTLRLSDVTFAQALATLARSNDLQTAQVGNVIYLGTADAINRRYGSAREAGTRTSVFSLRNGASEDVAKSLAFALPAGTLVVPDKRTTSVIVTGPAAVVERAAALVSDLDQPSGVRSATVAMHYVKAAETLKALEATLQIQAPSSAYASDQQNAIVLTGSSDFIARASALAARIDRPGQQVRYEVRVTDISPSQTANVGFLYGGVDATGTQQPGSGSTVTAFMRNSLGVNATINALATQGLAKILARPTISTLNNVQASLLVGEQYPVVYFDSRTFSQQVQFVNVGVNLIVTPTIGADGAITTELETDYSQVTGMVATYPIIATRKAQSILRVHDGETIVIAGLFSDFDTSTLTKVPFLADIPILGELFKNRARQHTRDEVVFLITPHLVADDDAAKGTFPANAHAATLEPDR